MAKKKSLKRAMLASALSLTLSCSMFVGTTFAWFTDTATSTGNIIQTGTLDIGMYYAEGKTDPTAAEWKNAENGAIFNYGDWEPGYLEAKHIMVENKGTLALNYQLRITTSAAVNELADMIDVYYFADATAINSRATLETGTYLGTMTAILGTNQNISNTVKGSVEAKKTDDLTLVLKMKEEAGDKYQKMSIGPFSVELVATQCASEKDSIDENYDQNVSSPELPAALVRPLADRTCDTSGSKLGEDLGNFELDVAYQFEPSETLEQAIESDYRYWHADFVVYADHTVAANSLALAGYYEEWCSLNNDKWVALTSYDAIPAGEKIRLVSSLSEMLSGNVFVNYEELCRYANDGIGFRCGAEDLDGSNEGTTLTVELRLYETYSAEEAIKLGYGNTTNQETGNYETIGIFTHTFGGDYVTTDDGAVLFKANDGDVVLYDVSEVNATEYTVPDGVTELGNQIFSTEYYDNTANIKTVVIPDTVTDFGATGVTATGASGGAFKNSAVEKIVLPEGMTEIPAAAFNGATNLTDVNIPASVTTIGVNAFRSTALEELTVPDTVTTISYGAFRDMTSLTTVTIEGDVHIPDYAFRGCSALRTVYINGANATVGSNMAFSNASSNNPGTNNITFYVKSEAVAAQVRACMGVGTNFRIYVNDVEVTVVRTDKELSDAIKNATDTTTILLSDGAYSTDLNLTVAAIGQEAQCENLIIKAAGENVTYEGTVTLGLYEYQTSNVAKWDANVTFEGITFDHATDGNHSLEIQSVKSLTLKNCKIIGDGEYGIKSVRQNNLEGNSKIIGCTFENAGMQVYGAFGTGLVIEDCTFNESRINVQGGNGVTVQNCTFNCTLIDNNIGDSFYAIRSNSTPITVKECKFNIKSKLTEVVATEQAEWFLLANRGTTNWTVTDCTINVSEEAEKQTQLKITACTSTGHINTTNVTVNDKTLPASADTVTVTEALQ